MKKIAIIFSGLSFTLMTVFFTPTTAFAQSVTYQPRTESELVAYLYGRIIQLVEIKAMLERQQGITSPTYTPSGASIDTHSALEITSDTAILRGEVVLRDTTPIKAWFEYGQDQKFLDQKTRQVTVKSLYDRAVRQKVTQLEDDERYYFRIASMTKEGVVSYGPIYGFRTDEADE